MSINDIVIIGAGGLGREVLFELRELNLHNRNYNILGFIDDNKSEGSIIHGLPVLGSTNYLLNYKEDISAVICVGNPQARHSIYKKVSKNTKIKFPNIIADDFRCSDFVKMGKGNVVCFSCIATVDIEIGDFVILSNGTKIGHDSKVGNFVTLYPSVNVSGNVNVGDYSELGVGASIIQNKSIGTGVVVGAGAVVINDIPKNSTAVGVPARVIKEI